MPAGTYRITRPIPPNGFNGEDAGDFNLISPLGPNQTLILGAGPALTIIDGNQLDAILRVDTVRTAKIEGLTLRNGKSLF